MINSFTNIHYCYVSLTNQISVGLLAYTHIPAALLAIILGLFIFFKTKNKIGATFFIVCLSFATWCFLDLFSWFAFSSTITMFTWSLLDFFAITMFVFSYYFVYVFIAEKDLPNWQKIISICLLLPTAFWTFMGSTLPSFNSNDCTAVQDNFIAIFPNYVEAVFIIIILLFIIKQYKKTKDLILRKKILFAGSGVLIFLVFFFSATILVNLLAESSASAYVYNYEIYGLFGMPILLAFIVFIVVKFKAFDIKLLATQALIWALIILVGSQFFFIRNPINYVLNGVTFVGAIISGVLIVRSVKRVDAQRELLALANQEQETLVHFITHQIKGYFTKSRNIFDTITDMENVPDGAQRLVTEGLRSDKEGVELVENILNAANMKNGKMKFEDKEIDLDVIVKKVLADTNDVVTAKNLKLNYYCSQSPVKFVGDEFRLRDVFKNLIQNSINYTFEGGITIYLNIKPDHIEFIIKDTGIGLTEDDKHRLFTSGGRGVESVKYNVSSTGYGLFIVKKVADNYKGRIWAESVGRGKGSTFTLILPL